MKEFPISFDAKDPDAICSYELDLSAYVAELLPNVPTAWLWSVEPILGDLAPLTVVAQVTQPDFSVTAVELSGGTIYYMYRVRADVTLADGQHDVVSFSLKIGYT